ncbi:MAG: Ada metal-binding domain-containing protein [Candidatus Eremiobacteraeota bacterium]|nr:Ada metal-binding domain-containing protein [Candidatus Eremiobacteraeota bacterium]
MRNMQRAALAALGLLFLIMLVAASPRPGYSYVGSTLAESRKFHVFDCQWAKKIKEKNAVYFKTRSEALKAGYSPCSVCRP